MRIHHLQHVPFEGLGSMEAFLQSKGHSLTATHLYLGEPLPSIDDLDLLIVMGGPMGVHDESQHPWLKGEKEFIKSATKSGKRILGICLGAQLIAAALGAKVTPNPHREIGWFPITPDPSLEASPLAGIFPHQAEVFHWHGDTFAIPDGATPIASSQACTNQGFLLDGPTVALQFHLETTPQSAALLLEHCGHELDGTPFVQGEKEILATPGQFEAINRLMVSIIEAMLQ